MLKAKATRTAKKPTTSHVQHTFFSLVLTKRIATSGNKPEGKIKELTTLCMIHLIYSIYRYSVNKFCLNTESIILLKVRNRIVHSKEESL